MLRAVTFDFWRTLYKNASAQGERLRLLDETLSRHSQPRPRADIAAAYRHAASVWEQIWQQEHYSIAATRWLHEIFSFLGVELPDEVLLALRRPMEEIYLHNDSWPQLVPGVAETLPRLSRNYRLGLISDTGLTPGRVLRELIRRDGLLDCFQATTFSDEIGAAKPRPEPFLITLDAMGVQPEQAVHVGDLPETDLVGARGVGMKTILFMGESNRRDGIPLADGVLETYGELEELVEKLA